MPHVQYSSKSQNMLLKLVFKVDHKEWPAWKSQGHFTYLINGRLNEWIRKNEQGWRHLKIFQWLAINFPIVYTIEIPNIDYDKKKLGGKISPETLL